MRRCPRRSSSSLPSCSAFIFGATIFIFAMLLCLLTNNVGILWIAMELATLSTVLLVSLYRTPAAIEAAWKYFIICGVGIAQALTVNQPHIQANQLGALALALLAGNQLGGFGSVVAVPQMVIA